MKERGVEQKHADYYQYAKHRPSCLDFLLMFFIEKHILSSIAYPSYYEKFSTKKRLERYFRIEASFNILGACASVFYLEHDWLVE